MSIPCSLGKTLQVGDKVFTTVRSDTTTFKKWATVVEIDIPSEPNIPKQVLVNIKGSSKSSKVPRKTSQLICVTQQIEYNLENYPENQL